MEISHPKRRFSVVAFDIETTNQRTKKENIMTMVIIDVFTCFVCAVSILNESAEIVALVLINSWILMFEPMERLLFDLGPK